MTHLELKSIVKDFGDFRAVDNLDLKIEKGEFVSLLGLSDRRYLECARNPRRDQQTTFGWIATLNKQGYLVLIAKYLSRAQRNE